VTWGAGLAIASGLRICGTPFGGRSPRLLQMTLGVVSVPLDAAHAAAFQAATSTDLALTDVPVLARLAGEVARQATRLGFCSCDDFH